MLPVSVAADLFVDGFAHLQAGEGPVAVLRSGPVRLVRWGPTGRRGTGFSEEFFPVDLDAETILAHVRAASPGPRHYLTAIGGDTDDLGGALTAACYTVNSRESLMALDLTRPSAEEPAHEVSAVSTAADAECIRAHQLAATGRVRLITPAQLADPAVLVRQILVDGVPACVGKAVLLSGRAFLSDIGTLPEYRRRGLARSLTLGLQAAARAAGVEHAVLTSSEMGRPLYRRLGYDALREIVIWEPALT